MEATAHESGAYVPFVFRDGQLAAEPDSYFPRRSQGTKRYRPNVGLSGTWNDLRICGKKRLT